MMIDDKLTFINMATYYQERMRYKSSWIQVIFKEKFGTWPNELLKQKSPIEPSNEFTEWVKEYQSRSFLNLNETQKNLLMEKSRLQLQEKEERKLISLSREISRKGKTAKELSDKFGISIRSVQTYTSMPRAEYLANSITAKAPWAAMGMSRATWYRLGKPAPPAPEAQEHDDEPESPPAPGC